MTILNFENSKILFTNMLLTKSIDNLLIPILNKSKFENNIYSLFDGKNEFYFYVNNNKLIKIDSNVVNYIFIYYNDLVYQIITDYTYEYYICKCNYKDKILTNICSTNLKYSFSYDNDIIILNFISECVNAKMIYQFKDNNIINYVYIFEDFNMIKQHYIYNSLNQIVKIEEYDINKSTKTEFNLKYNNFNLKNINNN